MLAWRALARRPASIVRQAQIVCRIPRRQLIASLPRANWQMTQARGPGFYAKLRFRKDGTPRSLRWVLKTLFGISLLLNLELIKDLRFYKDGLYAAHAMFLASRIDADFDCLDLDDPHATVDHFEKMLTSFNFGWKRLADRLRIPACRTEAIHEIVRDCVIRSHLILEATQREEISFEKGYGLMIALASMAVYRAIPSMLKTRRGPVETQLPEQNRQASAEDAEGFDRTPEPPAEKAATEATPDYDPIG